MDGSFQQRYMIVLFQQQYAYSAIFNLAVARCASSKAQFKLGINTGIISPQSETLFGALNNTLRLLAHEYILILRSAANGYLCLPTFTILLFARFFFYFHRDYRSYLRSVKELLATSCIEHLSDDTIGGDILDIYTTYLRFSSAQFYLRSQNSQADFFLKILVLNKISFRSLINALLPISISYITSYFGYIQHATPCRQFLDAKKLVYCIGSPNCNARVLTNVSETNAAPVIFDRKYISGGKSILDLRMKGAIDNLISYVPQSPYKSYDTKYPIHKELVGKPLVTIFMHEMSDFHHDNTFPFPFSNYYEWLKYTYNYLERNSINFVIKLHPSIIFQPNKYRSSWTLLRSIIGECNSKITDSPTTFLIDNGLSLGVTVEGSIGPELSYVGRNALALSSAPYSNYNVCHIAKSLNSYEDFLSQHETLTPHPSFRENSAIFIGSMAKGLSEFYNPTKVDCDQRFISLLQEARSDLV